MSDVTLSETTSAEKKPRKYTKPTERRVGPPCPTCGKSQSVAGVPKTEEGLAALKAKLAKLTKAAELAEAGITVKKLEPAAPTE